MDIGTNPNITLRQLWHFTTAAQCGTISEAARRLHMAPSAISMSIAELERQVGVQLCVRRKSHGLTLTSAGQLAFEQARQMLDLADELVHLSGGEKERLRGPLAVGCYMPLAPAVIPFMLRSFAERCPEVRVNFVEGYHDDLQDRLLAGDVDVCFLYDSSLVADIRSVPLMSVQPKLLLPEDHALAERASVSLAEVAEEPVILFDAPPISTRVLDLFKNQGLDPQVRHRSRSYATVRALVGAGMGVAVLYQQPALDLSYAGLHVVSRPLDAPGAPTQSVALAWAAKLRPNARARAWTELAVERFTDMDRLSER